MERTKNWGLAWLLAMLVGTAHYLDGNFEDDAAQNFEAAIQSEATQAAQERFAKASATMCGRNQRAVVLEDGSVFCTPPTKAM